MPRVKYLNDRLDRSSRNKRDPREDYLIFCEWKSEKVYFEYLRQYGKSITCKILDHKDYRWIADEIWKEIDWLSESDHIFCVIDKDNHQEKEYKENYERIAQYSKVIFSSKSFEVWILMHFSRFDKCVLKPSEYDKEINRVYGKYFRWKWIRKKIIKPYSNEIWEALDEKIKDAINNAKFVSEKQLRENNKNIFKCEPYTDVRKLVKELI